MYGLIGAGDFTKSQLDHAAEIKTDLGLTVDPWDKIAYYAGFDLTNIIPNTPGEIGPPKTKEEFCTRFNRVLNLGDRINPFPLREGNGEGHNTLTSCGKCALKTLETRHGGNNEPRINP